MSQPQLGRMTARHLMVVTGAGLLMALNVMWFIAAGLVLPPLAESLGIGLGRAMVFVSVNMLAGAATMALVGPRLMHRLGTRRLALLGGVLTGVAFFAVSYVGDVVTLYVLAFVSGMGATTSLQMTGAALVNDWFLERRGLMQGVVMGVASLGGVVSGTVLPGLVSASGWRAGFQLVGAVTVGVTLVSAVLLIRSHPADVGLHVYGARDVEEEEAVEQPDLPLGRAIRGLPLGALLVGLVVFSALMALQQHFAPLLAERGVSLSLAGVLFSALSLANVATTLVLGTLADRRGPRVAYVVSGVLLVAALSTFLTTAGLGAQTAAVLLFSLPAVTPPIMTPVLLRATSGPRAFRPLLGLATATMPVGIALGSPLWGWLKDATGSYTVALVAALVGTVVCVVLVSYALVAGPRSWGAVAMAAPRVRGENA